MTIAITPEIEELVSERIRSGGYASATEVILVSLRLLKEWEERLAELKREMQIGLDAIQQGRFTTCATDAELDDFAALAHVENGRRVESASKRKRNPSR
jgi:antitoxin ParD1/3/4